jgi:hypothetical protein
MLLKLAFLAALAWGVWCGQQGPQPSPGFLYPSAKSGRIWGSSGKENPGKPFEESVDSIAADTRATADYALACADAEDLADTGPGALERIRAARLTAISLALAADEAERKAQEANEAADKVAEEAARKSGVSSHPGAAKRREEERRESAGEGPGAPDPRE